MKVMASNQCPPPNPFWGKMIFRSSLFVSFHARFKCHLLRGVPMLMQYLPTTATACCFSTLLIHSRFDAYTFKIFSVLCAIFDFTRWGQITLSCTGHDTSFYFGTAAVLHFSHNMHILLTFPDHTPYYVHVLHLSRTFS